MTKEEKRQFFDDLRAQKEAIPDEGERENQLRSFDDFMVKLKETDFLDCDTVVEPIPLGCFLELTIEPQPDGTETATVGRRYAN